MNDISSKPEAGTAFRDAKAGFSGGLTPSEAAALASASGDVTLLIDRDGVVCDAAAAGSGFPGLDGWIGRPWVETVTIESRQKVDEMLAGASEAPRWRQVNQLHAGSEVPVRYLALPIRGGERILAIGRDMRASSLLQQRLLQAQQSLERDYLRLRQAESRYRLLFEMTNEPMLIVDSASRRIREANPAAARLFGAVGGAVAGQPLAGRIAAGDRDMVTGFLGAIAAGARPAPVAVRLEGIAAPATVAASIFRQAGATYFLLRLQSSTESSADQSNGPLATVIEQMPDAFVLADADLAILTANAAFVELVQAASLDQLRGRPLGDVLGRPGIDLGLILAQLAEQDVVRNVATILRGIDGGREEIELSAVRVRGEADHYGFSLRAVSRRLRDLPPAERDLPRSVEQLTELVGRMPLKDIVRESTDLIERLCIEAALTYTSNNRASAAEILGLSRQSLYAKLHRHGIVSPAGDGE